MVGDNNADATITTQGTGDLTLSTNSGTNSGNNSNSRWSKWKYINYTKWIWKHCS